MSALNIAIKINVAKREGDGFRHVGSKELGKKSIAWGAGGNWWGREGGQFPAVWGLGARHQSKQS